MTLTGNISSRPHKQAGPDSAAQRNHLNVPGAKAAFELRRALPSMADVVCLSR
jgi:hypothetical protein